MTATATSERARLALAPAPAAPENRPIISWEALSLLLAVVMAIAAASAAWAALDRRLANLEEQIPAGMIQRLDERTENIVKTLDRIEGDK
jgi:hypothetical protein